MNRSTLLSVARGDQPADLVLRNGQIVNVISGDGAGYSAKEELDLRGAFVAPGLIDAHVHIESSLCVPAQFASAVVPRGVTTVVTDPHEIANVAGVPGIRFMIDASRNLPL